MGELNVYLLGCDNELRLGNERLDFGWPNAVSIDSSEQAVWLDWSSTSPPPCIGFLFVSSDHHLSHSGECSTKSSCVTSDRGAAPSAVHTYNHFLLPCCCQLCGATYSDAVQHISIEVRRDSTFSRCPLDGSHCRRF